MKATRPVFLAAAVLTLVLLILALGGCADDSTQTMAGDTQTTTTGSVETTTTTLSETTTTQAPSTTEFTTTTTTLYESGPGPAQVVASVSIDDSVYEEEWDTIPCTCEDVTKSVYEGNKIVKKTFHLCKWPCWIRLTEKNGVAVLFERYGYFYHDPATGEYSDAGGGTGAWHGFDYVLPPHGTWERNLTLESEDGIPDLAGMYFVMKFEGHDANDNRIEFEVSIIPAPPS